MTAMLPLANSNWLLIIIGLLCLIFFVVFMVMLSNLEINDRLNSIEDESEYPPQPSNVRVLRAHPFDYDHARPYDYEVDE